MSLLTIGPGPCRSLSVIACTIILGGCAAIGGIAGGVAAIASGAATANPGVGVAMGIGVKAAVDASMKTVTRHWSDEVQTRIATTVGSMNVGESRPWSVEHALPYNNARGTVTLLRTIETPLALCKEALFTVAASKDAQAAPPFFLASACEGTGGWKWAVAEPAVTRWGNLQ